MGATGPLPMALQQMQQLELVAVRSQQRHVCMSFNQATSSRGGCKKSASHSPCLSRDRDNGRGTGSWAPAGLQGEAFSTLPFTS